MAQRLRTLTLVAASQALAFWASVAAAQTATESTLSETLYRQARELSAAGNLDEACPKFAESYRLDPGTGTLLNLAQCHESQGKIASAWLEFSDALEQARRDHRQSRIDYAEQHIAALEPKLSHLTVVLAPGADDKDLELELDGAVIGAAARGVPAPVDPGPHTVAAQAPGKKAWETTVEIGAVADQRTVTVPALEPEPSVRVAAAPVAVTPPLARAPTPVPVAPPPARRDVSPARPVPASVYVAGGATLALAVAASVTGGVYLDRRSNYESSGRFATKRERDSVQALGVVNLGLWVATAAGGALTTYLYLARPRRESRAALRVSGWVTAGGAGLAAGGDL